MFKFISFFILLGVISACNFSNKHYTKILKELDSKLEDQPEMVLDSLKKINPELLKTGQRAYYYLLQASATDKNLIYLENDSTLRIAYKYYKNKKDYYNLARSEYYLGKYEHKRKKVKSAYTFFKQAEINTLHHKENNIHLLGLIYYQLGLIQKQQNNLMEAENLLEKSFSNFIKDKDIVSAAHALKVKAITQIENKNYDSAKINLNKSLELICNIKNQDSLKVFLTKNSILSAFSYYYRINKNINSSLDYSKKCLDLFNKYKRDIPSEYYYNMSIAFELSGKTDSAKFYCNKMLTASHKENNNFNYINGYNLLSKFEERAGNYKEACKLKNYYNYLKDSLNEVTNKNTLIELESKYEKIENQRLILKAENSKLRAYAIITIIVFGLLIIGLPFYFRHRKIKTERDKLSRAIKHSEWGFLVTKEFITENHIAYDELERILNREKSLNNINSDMYNKFHEALIQQKANYSGRLFNRLTDFNGNFGTKFQQLFPEFTTDELLMAMMIHHQWKLADMTTIFHVSVDALRKRKTRLAHKISNKLKEDIDLDEYLSSL